MAAWYRGLAPPPPPPAAKPKPPTIKLSSYKFSNSDVARLGIRVLQMPGPKWPIGGANQGAGGGYLVSAGYHGNHGPRYTPSELSYFNQVAQITDQLFLSSAAAVTVEKALAHGITCIINVTVQIPTLHMPKVESIHLRLEDDPRTRLNYYFDPVADKIKEVEERGGRTLLHCVAGVSRSASLTIAYLVKHHRMTLRQAYLHVKARRPIIRPNLGFWRQLMDYEKKQRGCSTVTMVNSPVGQIPDVYRDDAKSFASLPTGHGSLFAPGISAGAASPLVVAAAGAGATAGAPASTGASRLPALKQRQNSSSGLSPTLGGAAESRKARGGGAGAGGQSSYFPTPPSSTTLSSRYSKSHSFFF